MRFLFGLLALVLLCLGLYAFWIEPDSLRLRGYDIALAPAQQLSDHPLSIAVIADLHAGAPYIEAAKIARVVALTQSAKPDLILMVGDYVAHEFPFRGPTSLPALTAGLRGLHAPLGVFAVLGNHDNAESTENVTHALQEAGIIVMDDRSTTLNVNGKTLSLVGFKDAYWSHPDVPTALMNVPQDTHALCFTHSPDLFPGLPKTCALTLAGHTHGGQVWLPFLGRPIIPSQYGQRYAAGRVDENGKTLFVSTGIGTSNFPVRFMVPPEISILNVR